MLAIKVTPSNEDMKFYMEFTWKTTLFEPNKAQIQLEFTYPGYISAETFDILEVKVLKAGKLKSSKRFVNVEEKTSLRRSIPKQVDGLIETEILLDASDPAQQGVTAFLGANFLISLLVGTSLNLLWGLVHSLEVTSPYFLLFIPMPINAQILYSAMYSVANF